MMMLKTVKSKIANQLKYLVLASCALLTTQVHAELTIEISDSYANAIPIAIVPFGVDGQPAGRSSGHVPVDLAEVVRNDLRRSGRFKPIDQGRLPAFPVDESGIDFNQWRGVDVDNLLVGNVVALGGDRYQIDIRFMDVLRKKQLFGKRWTVGKANLRQVAHQISDLIYEQLTGIRGAFNTQIAYVTVKKGNGQRQYTLEVADADGFNPQPILRSKQPIMSPNWSPDGRKLAYVSFEKGRSYVIVQSLDGLYRKTIAKYKGLNSAPAWSPNGNQIALTLSKDGSADVYVLDLISNSLRRITNDWSIETEASWAPDGQSLYFSSDRRGQPQIFQAMLNSGDIRRISYEGKYNASPEISPDGRSLAMVNGNGDFNIGLLDLNSNDFRLLTDTFLDESPTFAPNGEMILYASNRGGRGVLSVVSIDGKSTQTLKIDNAEVREPSWGPFLPR